MSCLIIKRKHKETITYTTFDCCSNYNSSNHTKGIHTFHQDNWSVTSKIRLQLSIQQLQE